MKKSIIALILSFLMVFPFAACGETPNPDPDENKPSIDNPGNGENPDPNNKPEDTGVQKLTFEETIREDYVNWFGRNLHSTRTKSVACNNTAAGFEVTFYGTELSFSYVSENQINLPGFLAGDCYVCVQVDGSADYVSSFTKLALRPRETEVTLVKDLEEGVHTVGVYKATEAYCATLQVYGIETDGFFMDPPEMKTLKLEAYGDSIVAGRGSNREPGAKETNESEQENGLASYAAFTARALNAQYNAFCVSGSCVGKYVNGTDEDGNDHSNNGAVIIPELSGTYSPLASARDVWDFSKYQPDVVLIEMGTNDIIDNYTFQYADFETQLKNNYSSFIRLLRERYPDAAIVACCGIFSYEKYPTTPYNHVFQEIVDSFSDDGNVYCYTFEKTCVKGHPSHSEAETFASGLAAYIRTILA